jgi:hypothetical protein
MRSAHIHNFLKTFPFSRVLPTQQICFGFFSPLLYRGILKWILETKIAIVYKLFIFPFWPDKNNRINLRQAADQK